MQWHNEDFVCFFNCVFYKKKTSYMYTPIHKDCLELSKYRNACLNLKEANKLHRLSTHGIVFIVIKSSHVTLAFSLHKTISMIITPS